MIPFNENTSCLLVKDISERKKMQAELQRGKESLEEIVRERTKELQNAVQVKSRFLAIMSHGKNLLTQQ